MGAYIAWIATGESDPDRARRKADELSAVYDETANAVPGRWPGLSFDYGETIAVADVPTGVDNLHENHHPDVLITPSGQIMTQRPDWGDPNAGYANIDYGIEAMMFNLLSDQDQSIVVAKWHC